MSEKVKIEMSEKQMLVMRDALEFYSRFLSGQLDALPDALRFKVKNRDGVDDALRQLKAALFPELHQDESYGVGAPRGDRLQELCQISYEMYRQIYVYQTEQRRSGGGDVSMDVYSIPTMRYSDEGLIKVEKL
jgi:hypothetical protein